MLRSKEQLESIRAVDTTPRKIVGPDMVECFCHTCKKPTLFRWVNINRTIKETGSFETSCKPCAGKITAAKRDATWLKNLRKAAQSEAHKQRARDNGRRKYHPEQILQVMRDSGIVMYEGDMSLTRNTLKMWWSDKTTRTIRIRRFMKDGAIKRPKTGDLNPNKIKKENKIKEMGLEVVEVLEGGDATLRYRGYTWTQLWPGWINRKCKRIMKRIDIGKKIEKEMEGGANIRDACKKHGIPPAAFYRRYARGMACPVEAAVSIKSFENILKIKGAVYNKKTFKDRNIRPDIVIKKHKLIIEVDGLHWHTEAKKDKKYHIDRAEYYKSKGYRLLVFSEKEVKEQREIVDSMINHRLGKTANKVGARKCQVVEMTHSELNGFFENNHLKGKGGGKGAGLLYRGEIVAAIRWVNNKDHYNISRFACKNNWSVSGAYSRLLKPLRDKDIVNFVDTRHGDGEHLAQYGFELVSTHLGFEWTDGYHAFNRRSFLGNSGYDKGLLKYWDYGQKKFVAKSNLAQHFLFSDKGNSPPSHI